jgi:UDP-4-amino-4,6-dideoxy-N-acetyl-beta-L-altrosamine N-acetyltransferase
MNLKEADLQKKTINPISNMGTLVKLRPIKKEDAQFSTQWRNDPEIRDNLLSPPFPVTEVMENKWIENILLDQSNSRIILAIETIIQQKLIGFIYLKNIDWVSRIAWFGIMIGEKKYQGKGMAREAMKILFDYAFARINLRKISLEVGAFNERAIGLYDSLGFKREGRLEQHVFLNNKYHDIILMSIFKKDYIS